MRIPAIFLLVSAAFVGIHVQLVVPAPAPAPTPAPPLPSASGNLVRVQIDDQFQFYADGVAVGSGSVWHQIHVFDIPQVTQVVAIYAKNVKGGGGIHVWSEAPNFIYSTTTVNPHFKWKCTAVSGASDLGGPAAWAAVNFDDNSWNSPVDLNTFSGVYSIPPNIQYIWATADVTAQKDVICRVYLTPTFINPSVSVQVDDAFQLFADGVAIGAGTQWNMIQTYDLQLWSQVVAIFAENEARGVGIHVWSNPRDFLSSTTGWKCIPADSIHDYGGPAAWATNAFDDGSWYNAVTMPYDNVVAMPAYIQYIWGYDGTPYYKPKVICRGRPHAFADKSSCFLRCGTSDSDMNCQCDSSCADFYDCCGDLQTMC